MSIIVNGISISPEEYAELIELEKKKKIKLQKLAENTYIKKEKLEG